MEPGHLLWWILYFLRKVWPLRLEKVVREIWRQMRKKTLKFPKSVMVCGYTSAADEDLLLAKIDKYWRQSRCLWSFPHPIHWGQVWKKWIRLPTWLCPTPHSKIYERMIQREEDTCSELTCKLPRWKSNTNVWQILKRRLRKYYPYLVKN